MNRFAGLALSLLSLSAPLPSHADPIATDVNIVTGLDISDSVTAAEMKLEIGGMAAAIRSPEVMRAIKNGYHGRVGFAVFAWHHNAFPELVEWTIISSESGAQAVAAKLEARLAVDVEVEGRKAAVFYIGRMTDLSQAVDHAAELLAASPFAAERSVLNIVGNGKDNVGDRASVARDRIVVAGTTVNGVVVGNNADVLDYFRSEVIGGPGAFVIPVLDRTDIAEAMKRKFVNDVIASAGP